MRRVLRLLPVLLIIVMCFSNVAAAEERFDTDVAGVNLTTALQGVAMKAGMEYAGNQKLDGVVTLHLVNKTARETMEAMARVCSFNWSISDNVIYASPADIGTQIRTYPVKYVDLKYAQKALALVVSEKNLSVNDLDSTITMDGTAFQHDKARQTLALVDVPQKQVHLKAKLIEISKSTADKLGFSYSMPVYDSTATTKLQYSITSEAEKSFAGGKTLAQPSVMTLNGREAKLLVGETVPVFTTIMSSDGSKSTTVSNQEVGITLIATPRINEDGTITTKFKVSIKAIESWTTSGTNKAPTVSNREATTEARVQSGETIVIGGLLKDSELKNLSEVPGLSKIPILGGLFKYRSESKEQTETFIFLSPEIVDDLKSVKAKQEDILNGGQG